MKSVRVAFVATLCLALAAGAAYGQSAPPAQGQTGQTTGQTPTQPAPAAPAQPQSSVSQDSFNRIREAVNRPAALKVENGQLKIYVEVIGYWPSFAEVAKGYDLMNGPAPTGPNAMSHGEFLAMMRPQELGQPLISTGGGGGKPGVGQKAVNSALKQIFAPKNDKKSRQIQEQIDRELAALRGGK